MRKKSHISLLFFILIFLVFSCEKEISIVLPDAKIKPVIEGRIEPNFPPLIIVTKNMDYFAQTDINTINNLFIHDATITLKTDSSEVILTEYCTSDIPDSLKKYMIDFYPVLSSLTGIPLEFISTYNYCIYSTVDFSVWGDFGKKYDLTIKTDNKIYTASTTIPNAVNIDSLWFKPKNINDSLGSVWAKLTDPPEIGNCYRWFAKRLGKDNAFIAPRNSSFEDKFVNGKTFNFGYTRGSMPNSAAAEDNNRERGAYKVNDTVVVKFCTIDRATFEFIDDFETSMASGGNPFGSPSTIKSNINGGALGYWGGYGVGYDTLIIKP
jgi:hypothetical protein